MAGDHNVNISTEEVSRIESIVSDAFERMNTSASNIKAQADAAGLAYKGSGTGTMIDSYTNLGGAGKTLGDALNGLLSDLGATNKAAHETDDSTSQAASQGAAGGSVVASGITAGM